MSTIAELLVAFVALIHVAIAVTEMFFWKSPRVHTRLGFTADEANRVAPIVANAGLYNAFLAAGLIWGIAAGLGNYQIQMFFLICVVIAGLFGAITLKWTTLMIQSAPAIVAILAVCASHSR